MSDQSMWYATISRLVPLTLEPAEDEVTVAYDDYDWEEDDELVPVDQFELDEW